MDKNLGEKRKRAPKTSESDSITLMGVEVNNQDIGHNSNTYGAIERMGVRLTEDAVEAIEEGFDGRSYPISKAEIYGEDL